MSRLAPLRRPTAEAGVILVMVMLLLVVTTLLSIASFRTTVLEERMAGHVRDRQAAFQAGEAALRDAEQMMRADTDGPFQPLFSGDFDAACTGGLCRSSPGQPLWSTFQEADWAGPRTFAYGAGTGEPALTDLAEQPRFIVEYQGTTQPIEPGKPCVAMFLVTARASGVNPATRVALQTVYRKRSGDCRASV